MSWPAPDQDSQYLDTILRQTRDAMRHLRAAKHMIGQVEGTGEAADGLIRVRTGADGVLRHVDLNPRALRLTPEAIGREVTRAIQSAQDDSARQAKEIVNGVASHVDALPEPLDERFVEHRVETAMRDLYSGGL
ncbi:YbaB/EbfC family nucleoid-associated protein [Nonomuraea sp. NPDC050404]|uniref:YbaB/EbfC family nucleoid-associated protein n=1 Tax=Nonomuraea sp. NPDC050404 TaxID=3155783 RepID=UPI0033FB46A5